VKGFRLFLALFALSVVVGGGGVWLLWQRYGGSVAQEFDRVRDDAQAFASEHEQAECAPEALGRLQACGGLWCMVQTPIFTRECLRRARPSPNLCDGVPPSLPAALVWPTTTCAELDVDPEVCQRILREVLKVCLPERF
jgi:hypothetical protein